MRIGVGIIILNNSNQVFVGKRKDNSGDKWQMPQGGVDQGEDFKTAMKRELMEETSIKNIKNLKEIDKIYEYELPENLVGIIWKGKFKGQKQKWFLLGLEADDSQVELDKFGEPEFDDWRWVSYWYPVNQVIEFKRDVYRRALRELLGPLERYIK